MELLAVLFGFLFTFGSAVTADDVSIHPHLELSAVPPGHEAPFGSAGQYQERGRAAFGLRLDARSWGFGPSGPPDYWTVSESEGDLNPGWFPESRPGIPVSLDWTGTGTGGGWEGWLPDNSHQIRASWENQITLSAKAWGATWYVKSVEVNAWHHTDAPEVDYWRVGVRKEW